MNFACRPARGHSVSGPPAPAEPADHHQRDQLASGPKPGARTAAGSPTQLVGALEARARRGAQVGAARESTELGLRPRDPIETNDWLDGAS